MKIDIYQVDAFTDKPFHGNPAAVCPLQEWLPDELMQQIALENNLSETAFFVPEGDGYRIRWFTPTIEVDLCGHATLASAHVLYSFLDYQKERINFESKGGILTVSKAGRDLYALDFPRNNAIMIPDPPRNILDGLNLRQAEVHKGRLDYMVVLNTQEEIERLKPDFSLLAESPARGVVVTAPGNDSDFVSRCFYPQTGVNEDPVTGSAHTMSAPYWAKKLGKNKLSAIQLSARRGFLECQVTELRVIMTGSAVTFLKGEITV
ncbi:MAG: PhzF family phenazine biosynthesis protein [Chitinophagaceae bacterium]